MNGAGTKKIRSLWRNTAKIRRVAGSTVTVVETFAANQNILCGEWARVLCEAASAATSAGATASSGRGRATTGSAASTCIGGGLRRRGLLGKRDHAQSGTRENCKDQTRLCIHEA